MKNGGETDSDLHLIVPSACAADSAPQCPIAEPCSESHRAFSRLCLCSPAFPHAGLEAGIFLGVGINHRFHIAFSRQKLPSAPLVSMTPAGSLLPPRGLTETLLQRGAYLELESFSLSSLSCRKRCVHSFALSAFERSA